MSQENVEVVRKRLRDLGNATTLSRSITSTPAALSSWLSLASLWNGAIHLVFPAQKDG